MTPESRCDLSDLYVSACHHCISGYPNLGPMQPDLDDDEVDET